MIIRKAKSDDLVQLLSLYKELNPDDDIAEITAAQKIFLSILHNPVTQIIVLENDGLLVSSCYLNIIPNLTRGMHPYAVIENVITAKKNRQKGFGSSVMQFAINTAKNAGCYKIMLLTGRTEQHVHDFYNALGFDGDSKKGYQIRFQV